MGDDQRCRTRIETAIKTNYMVTEDVDEVHAQIDAAGDAGWVELTSMTGQTLFPPERLLLRARDIASVQEMSESGWLWSKRATELHYARQIEDLESAPWKRIAEAQERLVRVLADEDEGDE